MIKIKDFVSYEGGLYKGEVEKIIKTENQEWVLVNCFTTLWPIMGWAEYFSCKIPFDKQRKLFWFKIETLSN